MKYALADRVEISSSCQRIVLSANWFVSDTQMKPNCFGYYYIIALLHCYYMYQYVYAPPICMRL